MKKVLRLLCLFLVVAFPVKVFSMILNVPNSYSSIQDGIDSSIEGDTVLVDPGIYYENLNLNGKNIVLCSWYLTTGNTSYISNTIIDGSNAGRVLTIDQGENTGCIIAGFTIQHGNSSSESGLTYGGGVFISDCSPQVRNCIIQLNYAPANGGGIAIYGSNSAAKVNNCQIQNNSAESFGGGVFMGDCSADAEIVNSIISGNTITCYCNFNGGGAGVNLYHTGHLTNCLVIYNSAPNAEVGGGGVYCDWGDFYGSQGIVVTGCTIVNNTALNWGGTNSVINGGEFRNCIIWGNTDTYSNISNYDESSSYLFCCSDPLPSGVGNISADPGFINPSTSNFRLPDGSPCINTGENSYNTQMFDLDGNQRVVNTIDMGAYEKNNSSVADIQIGSGTDQAEMFPIYAWYGYSYSQQIYLGSEITSAGGSAGSISKIRFLYQGGGTTFSNWNNWTIYLGNTTKTEFTGSSDWVPSASMTQVFSGTIPDPVEGQWVEITLSTPFAYTGNNIVVAVDENSDYWDWSVQWASFNTGSPRGLVFFDDNINPDAAAPPESYINPEYSIAQVQFFITTGYGVLEGHITEEPYCTDPVEGATVTTGSYTTTTDASGFYQFTVPIGTYFDVTAHHGDVSQTISPVTIVAGNTTTQDFCLAPYFPPPVALKASLSGPIMNNVHLSWLAPGSVADQWIHWDNGILSGGLGYNGPATFTVASRWPVADIKSYDGSYLKKVRFVITEPNATYTLKVWKGADASTLLLSQPVVDPLINNWNEVTLTTPILIDGTSEFWFGYEVVQTSGYPAGLSPGPAIVGKGDMINTGYGWFSVKEAWGFEFNWSLEGFVSESAMKTPQPLVPMVQNIPSDAKSENRKPILEKPGIFITEKTVNGNQNHEVVKGDDLGSKSYSKASGLPGTLLTGYNVYRNSNKIGDNIPDLLYNDLALTKGNYIYEVSAQYDLGESARVPVNVNIFTCFPPTGLKISTATLTTTSANILWTPSTISTNLQWEIEWGPEGFWHGYGTTAFVNATPNYALTNLSPGTSYDFYVRTYCSSSDASDWVKINFRTHYFTCPSGSVSENEVCGTNTNGCPAAQTITSGQTICGTSWLNRSQRDADWYVFTLTQPCDVTVTGNAEFTNFIGIGSAPCPSAMFYNSVTNGAGYPTEIITQLASAGTYYIFVAPSYSEQVACDSLNKYWIKLTTNSCLTPTALDAVNVTTTTADLTWTSAASAWKVEWGPFGFTKGNGTVISGISSKPYHLTGLTSGIAYSYYVQSNCGAGSNSNWAGPFTFFTPCPATTLPYSEDFTSQPVGFTPTCWHVVNPGLPSTWTTDFLNGAGGSSPELVFHPSSPWFSGRSYIVSPIINTSGETALNLSFRQFIDAASSGTTCEIWTTSNGGITWTAVWSYAHTGTTGPEIKSLEIANSDVGTATFQFAFAENGNSWDINTWRIDNIALIPLSAKTLNLNLFLEGLYTGGGTMNRAYDASGPKFGTGIADQVVVELHNSGTYGTIVYSSGLVNLSTGGDIALSNIPANLSGSYYITVKHRSSIETTSASPVSFAGGTINYAFDTPLKAFGNNLVLVVDKYCIYGGDVNQDGVTDAGDLLVADNKRAAFSTGYIPEDANGSGAVDNGDLNFINHNCSNFIRALTP